MKKAHVPVDRALYKHLLGDKIIEGGTKAVRKSRVKEFLSQGYHVIKDGSDLVLMGKSKKGDKHGTGKHEGKEKVNQKEIHQKVK